MPPIPVPYTPRPFVGDRYEPHDRTPEYMRQSTRDEVEMMRRQGERSAQMWSGLGDAIGGTLRDIAAYPDLVRQRQMAELKLQDERDQAARAKWEFAQKQKAMEQQASEAQKLNGLMSEYGGRPPAERIAREFGPWRGAQIDKALDEIFGSPKDAAKRGSDIVKDMGGYGPLSENSVDDVMQSPDAGRVHYLFGPTRPSLGEGPDGFLRVSDPVVNGPEVVPNRIQQEAIDQRNEVKAKGGFIQPNGTINWGPPKPPAPPRVPVGSFEDYVISKFGPRPSPEQIEQARQTYGQADNKPAPSAVVPPGNWEVEGDAFLSTIPANWRKTVEKVANYDEDPTKVVAMRGGSREQLMQWVNQVNPKYDQSQFALRSPTRKAFTIGTQGQQINAINTAIGHIDQMDGLIERLGNSSVVPLNKLINWGRTTFGSDKVTNFDTLKDALSAEVASVLSKGQATVSEIAEQRQKINAASSPEALLGYMRTQIPIMGSKLAELDYQYKQAMGGDDRFSALSPRSKQILMKHGFDPAHPEITSSSIPSTPGQNPFRPKKP